MILLDPVGDEVFRFLYEETVAVDLPAGLQADHGVSGFADQIADGDAEEGCGIVCGDKQDAVADENRLGEDDAVVFRDGAALYVKDQTALVIGQGQRSGLRVVGRNNAQRRVVEGRIGDIQQIVLIEGHGRFVQCVWNGVVDCNENDLRGADRDYADAEHKHNRHCSGKNPFQGHALLSRRDASFYHRSAGFGNPRGKSGILPKNSCCNLAFHVLYSSGIAKKYGWSSAAACA